MTTDAAPLAASGPLLDMLGHLHDAGYAFVSPTPGTHGLVAGRREQARDGDLRDIFGWGLRFQPVDLPPPVLEALSSADGLQEDGGGARSRYRVSALDERLHAHSMRSSDPDAVFLGPDSYRFVRFLDAELAKIPHVTGAVDIGVGAGAGALAVAHRFPEARVVGVDVNAHALNLFLTNAEHAGLAVEPVLGSGLAPIDGEIDLIVSNPPFIAEPNGRTYRDGGDDLGTALALGWAREGLNRLSPGGRFLLYTGSPIQDGRDPVQASLQALCDDTGASLRYEELDPDIFGSTLRQPLYEAVERIAAVGAVIQR